MSNRLVLLLGEFETSEKELSNVLQEWSDAGLLATVGWTSVSNGLSSRPRTRISDQGECKDSDLFELLTSRIWSQVTVVAIRQPQLHTLSKERFDNEVALLQTIENSFSAHKQLEFSSFTVSIGEEKGLVYRAFSPYWRLHVLHEPVVRIDQAVASQPMWDDHRHLLVALLAISTAGGFIWQYGSLVAGLADPVNGSHRPIRIGRAYLRVVSAGRLTDEVLSGAFPASGPWSIPSDVPNSIAVPPGSLIGDNVVSAINAKGGFQYKTWVAPKREKPKNMGILQAIKLFLREFFNALKSIPMGIVERLKEEVEDFVQKTTFGANASVLVRFDPSKDVLDPDEVLHAIRNLHLNADVDPIGNSEAWEVLQRVSMSSVDGGRFPSDIPVPSKGSSRLVYTDPSAIGPSPSDASFTTSDFERALLNLEDSHSTVTSMAIEDAKTLQLRLEALRAELSQAESSVAGSSPVANKDGGTKGKKVKKLGWLKRRRQKKREKKEAKAAAVRANAEAMRKAAEAADLALKAAQARDNDEAEAQAEPSDTPDVASNASPDVAKADAVVAVTEVDRHKPNHPEFKQSEYTELTAFYQGEREEMKTEYADANRVYEASKSSYTSASGNWSKNKSCDHCGTNFDHGFVFLHNPSSELVHVGRLCAKNAFPVSTNTDLFAQRLEELETRFSAWMAMRSGSLLWRVGQSIVDGTINARITLAQALEILEKQPQFEESALEAQKKFGRWTRRGLMLGVLLAGACVASIILTPLPLLIFILSLTGYFTSFVIRIVFLAREIVRAQYALRRAMDEYERTYDIARHAIGEIVRLSSVRDQFEDWQIVIREIVHVPFGKEIGFATSKIGVEEVTRPPAMILGKSRPDDKQKMQLFLNARRQTIHGGWLTEIMDMMKDEWREDYANARLTTPADNILPEADNASSQSIVGKRPLSDEDVYYPRADFRRRIVSGDLQRKLVAKKAEQVAIDLKRTSLDQLLAHVEVSGLGSALSGQKVVEFLSGLSVESQEKVAYPADLISHKYPGNRIFGPELTLPEPSNNDSEVGQIQVKPGVELTAAAWRVELSGPIYPLDVLKGFEGDREVVDPGTPDLEEPGNSPV
jgi:hypothetical protein